MRGGWDRNGHLDNDWTSITVTTLIRSQYKGKGKGICGVTPLEGVLTPKSTLLETQKIKEEITKTVP